MGHWIVDSLDTFKNVEYFRKEKAEFKEEAMVLLWLRLKLFFLDKVETVNTYSLV